jgi:hypothetical protein
MMGDSSLEKRLPKGGGGNSNFIFDGQNVFLSESIETINSVEKQESKLFSMYRVESNALFKIEPRMQRSNCLHNCNRKVPCISR